MRGKALELNVWRLREVRWENCGSVCHAAPVAGPCSTLEGSLSQFKFLQELDLANNDLANLDVCLEILRQLRYLRYLDLRNNPIAQEVGYRKRIIELLPSLYVLDQHVVTDQERQEVQERQRCV